MSEHASDFEQCDHIRCEFPHKLEYCELEGSQVEGGLTQVNINMLHTLLYEHGDFERGGFSYRGNCEVVEFDRIFDMLSGDLESTAPSIVQTAVTIRHTKEKSLDHEKYEILTSWIVEPQDLVTEGYRTNYTLETWPGSVAATITDYNIKTEQLKTGESPVLEDRPMANYDHEALFDLLCRVFDLQTSAASERSASQARQ